MRTRSSCSLLARRGLSSWTSRAGPLQHHHRQAGLAAGSPLRSGRAYSAVAAGGKMPLTTFTEEEVMLREAVATFAEEQIKPKVSEMDVSTPWSPQAVVARPRRRAPPRRRSRRLASALSAPLRPSCRMPARWIRTCSPACSNTA